MTELTEGAMEQKSSWSEGFVGGFVVCRRLLAKPSFWLRDIGAYVVLTLVSFGLVLNLVNLRPGFPSVVTTEGFLLYSAFIPVAMALAALELRALRRSERVPQFG